MNESISRDGMMWQLTTRESSPYSKRTFFFRLDGSIQTSTLSLCSPSFK